MSISHLPLCSYWSLCHPFMLRSWSGSLGQRHRHLGYGPSPPPSCSRVDCGKSLLNTQQLESWEDSAPAQTLLPACSSCHHVSWYPIPWHMHMEWWHHFSADVKQKAVLVIVFVCPLCLLSLFWLLRKLNKSCPNQTNKETPPNKIQSKDI